MSRVALFVAGGIAAYKSCEVMRSLQRNGHEVRVAMTSDAQRFVGPVTFEALSHAPVLCDLYGQEGDPIPHISLSGWADIALVCPATANLMAKMACGIADDAVSSTLLACACPIVVAPAMNERMWSNPATQHNIQLLRERGVHIVAPGEGLLACGDVGTGKLATVDEIVAAVQDSLNAVEPAQDLSGRVVLVNAGPTHEAIDPVRFIANASTGKMGYAIARELLARGAEVRLVSGPVSLEPPTGAQVTKVVSAAQMLEACLAAFEGADAAICTAAVADYTPRTKADHKLKKAHDHLDVIELVETADILAALSERKQDRVVVGFAAETENLISYAQDKLRRKGCDLIIANDVSRADSTFGADTSRISFVSPEGVQEMDTMPLADVAASIADRLAQLLGERG